MSSPDDTIIILDFGSQYTQLIARRIREIGVYAEVLAGDADMAEINRHQVRGIIFSGGPSSVTDVSTIRVDDRVYQLNVPILGICYGMQMMASQLGGEVERASVQEFGYACVTTESSHPLFAVDGAANDWDVWMSHGDRVSTLPSGFTALASSKDCPIAAMAHQDQSFFGLQFHPEVTHTPMGQALLKQFVCRICACRPTWKMDHILQVHVDDIRERVGDRRVLLGLSGGVDSSVVAALLHEAIKDQLTCVFVDHGLLRYQESEQVMQTFAQNMGVHVVRVDARDRFFNALKGLTDPEVKRKCIGHLFIDIFAEAARDLGDIHFLAQGTIYSDVIESAKTKHGKSEVIKSHHNVGGLPDDLPFELLEPVRDLFKDEVRLLGAQLGLPQMMIDRHPFPGPGLAVRIMGEVTPSRVRILQHADHLFVSTLVEYGLYQDISQAFAVFLPVKSVGVKGDCRSYGYVIALRAVVTTDFMTAQWAEIPHDVLASVSDRIMNEIADVTRVVYDISGKPPSTIEWE